MFRKYGLPILAIIGTVAALAMIWWSAQTPPVANIVFPPAKSPYASYIAGVGIIESIDKNIEIGVPFPELVVAVHTTVGSIVKEGTPLFELDIRKLTAELSKAEQELQEALIVFQNAQQQYAFYEQLCDKSAVSERAYTEAYYGMKEAEARVDIARAQVHVIKTDIERSTIRAPIDGQVLQLDVRVGQYANVNPFDQKPLLLFGDISVLHVRIDIDEEDAWRVIPEAPAIAFVRGNQSISIPLTYAYMEPYIIPKSSLSSRTNELVDTRVLQLVYQFERKDLPVFVGELLDVYVEAKPHEALHG